MPSRPALSRHTLLDMMHRRARRTLLHAALGRWHGEEQAQSVCSRRQLRGTPLLCPNPSDKGGGPLQQQAPQAGARPTPASRTHPRCGGCSAPAPLRPCAPAYSGPAPVGWRVLLLSAEGSCGCQAGRAGRRAALQGGSPARRPRPHSSSGAAAGAEAATGAKAAAAASGERPHSKRPLGGCTRTLNSGRSFSA